MGENTGISWAHNTQNFWVGCDKVDPGCQHCYIHRVLEKQGREPWGEVYRTKTWSAPMEWQRNAQKANHAVRVFTCSLSDFFHTKADPWRAEAWKTIRNTPNLNWLILTKRPELIAKRLPADWSGIGFDCYPNVWLGVSVCHRGAYRKMDILREIPCALRWISAEPLLEDLHDINLDGFGWVVAGGESGSGEEILWNPNDWTSGKWKKDLDKTEGRRTMKPEWAEKIRDKTKAAGLPFMFKQVTAPTSGRGVNALGRDWHEFPNAAHGLPWAPRAAIDPKNLFSLVQIQEWRQRVPAPTEALYTRKGLLLATGYERIVVGGRGPYVEINESQMVLENIHLRKNVRHHWYTEFRSNEGPIEEENVKVYLQRRTIGYADYKVGLYYVSPADLRGDVCLCGAPSQNGVCSVEGCVASKQLKLTL
jgi:protein gp37